MPEAAARSRGGLVHVRQLSLLSWRPHQQPKAAPEGLAAGSPASGNAQQPQLQLVVEPAEGFAAGGGFDAAAAQQEVQQERPQLGVQLAKLHERQEQGELPGPEQLQPAALPTQRCQQNRVAPPPPPPLPPPAAAAPGPAAGWVHPMPPGIAQQPWQQAVPGQQQVPQQAWQPLPLQQHTQQQQVQQQQAQQQGSVMRPLYHQQAQQQQQYMLQPLAWPQPAGMFWVPPPPPGPPPGPPPVQPPPAAAQPPEQRETGRDNKRAAEGVKARLQGGKRQRQGDGGSDAAGAVGGAQQTQQAEPQPGGQPDAAAHASSEDEQRQEQPQPWLEGAPPGIRQLASGGSGCSGGPEVLFLGTGSAEPSKYRGASAIQLWWALALMGARTVWRMRAGLSPCCRRCALLCCVALFMTWL